MTAERETGDATAAPDRSLLTLRLGESRFGLWLDQVLEILRTPPISRLPLAAAEVAGVVSVRGDIVPVLDLGVRLLGSPAQRPGRLVLVRHPGSETMVGLLVDAVETLVVAGRDDVRPAPPEAEAEHPPGYVTGVVHTEDLVVTVLDLDAAVAPPVEPEEEE